MKRIGKCLNKDAQIVLSACSTAGFFQFAQAVSFYTKAQVFANEEAGNMDKWTFKEDGRIDKCHFLRGSDSKPSDVVIEPEDIKYFFNRHAVYF